MLKNICEQLLLLQNQKPLLITCDWDSDAYGGESLVAAVHSHFSLGNQFLQNLQLKFCLYARTIRIFSWLDHQLFLRILPCTNKLFLCVRLNICILCMLVFTGSSMHFLHRFYAYETMEGWVQLKCCSLPFLTVESLSEYTLFVNYWLFCKVSLKRNAAKMQSEKAFEKAFDLEDPVLNIN